MIQVRVRIVNGLYIIVKYILTTICSLKKSTLIIFVKYLVTRVLLSYVPSKTRLFSYLGKAAYANLTRDGHFEYLIRNWLFSWISSPEFALITLVTNPLKVESKWSFWTCRVFYKNTHLEPFSSLKIHVWYVNRNWSPVSGWISKWNNFRIGKGSSFVFLIEYATVEKKDHFDSTFRVFVTKIHVMSQNSGLEIHQNRQFWITGVFFVLVTFLVYVWYLDMMIELKRIEYEKPLS